MSGFEEFYRSSYSRLFRVVVTVTTDRQDAQDVLQEAYAKAAADWARVGQLDNPGAWVRRVAVNRAVDLHRRGRRRRLAYERLERVPQYEQASSEVEQGLRTLRPQDRQVVVLHHVVGLSVAEIANEVGRPSGTVKSQLVRGRRQLAAYLDISREEVT
jgi:RNA polymerase sigma-70 factor (ECF subfamily)